MPEKNCKWYGITTMLAAGKRKKAIFHYDTKTKKKPSTIKSNAIFLPAKIFNNSVVRDPVY